MFTLRRLLTLGFSLLVMLPIAAGGLASWYLLMPGLRAQAIEANTMLAKSVVGQVRNHMSQPRDLLSAGAATLMAKGAAGGPSIDETLRLITRANSVLFATYLTDAQHRVSNVALSPAAAARIQPEDLIGLDLSTQRAFSGARQDGVRWSDVFFSAISMEPTIVAAIDIPGGTLAGEVSLARLAEFVRWAAVREDMRVIIADARGQVLAHPDPETARRFANVSHLSLLQRAVSDVPSSAEFDFGGTRYFGTAMRIAPQNWVVLVARPSEGALRPGWNTLRAVAAIGVTALGLALVLAVMMSRWLASRTEALAEAAVHAAEGRDEKAWPHLRIVEYVSLAKSLRSLIATVRERKAELQHANAGLEDKVRERTAALTAANAQLADALKDLSRTRFDLDHAERLASLGRLVAGIAHELNTPIGNSLIVASTLSANTKEFSAIPKSELKRSTLEDFQARCLEASDIIHRNLERAAELIHTYKQVAVDQSTAQRRRFQLADILDETRRMLAPTLRRQGVNVSIDVPQGIAMDSFPGPLRQVLTNLIENAMVHGYRDVDVGTVRIEASTPRDGCVVITINDDGVGIDEKVIPHIFEPFFTTRFGEGGTGLGLHICYQIVTGLLGGSISVESVRGQGSSFLLEIPLVAANTAEFAPTDEASAQ